MAVRQLVGIVLALAAVALVGGCSPSTDGDPQPVTTTVSQAALWDPCTIPDDALQRTGVDPATEERDIAGVKQEGWKICGWKGPWYFLEIFSTNYTLDDVKRNPRNTEVRDVTVGPRQGVMYHETSDKKLVMCDIAFGLEQGALLVRADTFGSESPREDPCVVVTRHAGDLQANLPTT